MTELPASELTALVQMLGRLDYGDHEDEVEPPQRNREASAILEWMLARGWKIPESAGPAVTLRIENPKGEPIRLPGGSLADQLQLVYLVCPWASLPSSGDDVECGSDYRTVEYLQLQSSGSAIITIVNHEGLEPHEVRDLLSHGWQPTNS